MQLIKGRLHNVALEGACHSMRLADNISMYTKWRNVLNVRPPYWNTTRAVISADK